MEKRKERSKSGPAGEELKRTEPNHRIKGGTRVTSFDPSYLDFFHYDYSSQPQIILFSCQNAFSSSCAGVNGVRLISCLIAPFLCYFHNPLLTSPQKKLRHDCCYGAPSSHNSPTKKECGLQKEAF